jgi:hypothetical protein
MAVGFPVGRLVFDIFASHACSRANQYLKHGCPGNGADSRPIASGGRAISGAGSAKTPITTETTSVDAIINYFYSLPGMIINGVILLALIGLLLYLRNKQSEE